ncbi:MAG: tRNA dihydrouridine synthase DusB [Treponema sp.]|nr:tRNA dihydrouridine synthase DusB [Spirochaetia bacterium]MDD7460531.1 tRNA dihydrouridine synthase DusB [Spirochaetales bacterium]MDY5812077.1 tRNA dihydrouridine synthase DusB [Treponema sp.]MEE1180838.1 tRNA dihydrouridine synthase DusB [Treponema sp.]
MNGLYHPVDIGPLHIEGNLFLAPIAGYSDRAFRSLCIDCGASFCTTEMVSAEALTRGNIKTADLMARAPNEKKYAVQIFGGNAEVMAAAAKIVLEKTTCESIDINGGCPVPKIVKSGAGSMLTKEPERLFSIVKAVKESSINYTKEHPERGNVPVTIKIRSGWDSEHITWEENLEAAIEAGADALTIHARTRAQGYAGKADWQLQAELVEQAKKRIPVFGSGDAFTPETAEQMLKETACDGVMFARGAMGDPFLFRRTIQYLTQGNYIEETVAERIAAGFKELAINMDQFGEKSACLQMRKKFCAYSSGIRGGSQIRARLVRAETEEDYRHILAEFL